MATNPYVRWWSDTSEQALLQSLMTEAIQMYGIDVIYIPREMRREDALYTEDVLSRFTETYPIEVYIRNIDGWEGQGDFLSKFGIRVEDKLTIMISRERFAEAVPNLIRPNEGDLIFFPDPLHALFEIKMVEHEKGQGQFYPLGGLTFYELNIELHTYSHEEFQTGDEDIDEYERIQTYAQNLVVANTGSGSFVVGETIFQGVAPEAATATAVVEEWDANTGIVQVSRINGEFGNTAPLRGETSGAQYPVAEAPRPLQNVNEVLEDNEYLVQQALGIVVPDDDTGSLR